MSSSVAAPPPGALTVQVLRALADPTRLQLVRAMSVECKSVSQLVADSGLAQPMVSYHLAILREAGVARFDRRAGYKFYCLVDQAVWETVQSADRVATMFETASSGSL